MANLKECFAMGPKMMEIRVGGIRKVLTYGSEMMKEMSKEHGIWILRLPEELFILQPLWNSITHIGVSNVLTTSYPFQELARGRSSSTVPFEIKDKKLPALVVIVPRVLMSEVYREAFEILVTEVEALKGSVNVSRFEDCVHFNLRKVHVLTYIAFVEASLEDNLTWLALRAVQ